MLIKVYGHSRKKARSQENNSIPLSQVTAFGHETAQDQE